MRYRLRTQLRFSLRTLLAVVTAIGCFLGYELNWIMQRREFLLSHGLGHVRDLIEQQQRWQYGIMYSRDDFHSLGTIRKCPRAPSLLWLFGESGVNTILMNVPKSELSMNGETNEYDAPNRIPAVAELRRLFPEATLYWSAITGPWQSE